MILAITLIASGITIGSASLASPGKAPIEKIKETNGHKNVEEHNPKYDPDFVDGEILVSFKNDIKPFRVIKVPAGQVNAKVKEYKQKRNVIYAEPNYIAHVFSAPNDPYYSLQWHLDNSEYGGIGMEEAWDISAGAGVIVAVIDTGVAYEDYGFRYKQAPDLADTCFVAGYDFINNDNHPNDDHSHGTHVAGTIAQSTNNGVGVAGVAFNVSLMPVKVLDKNGSGYHSQIADGIHYAADNGANVINLSLGGSDGSDTLRNAIAYAYGKGVTIIAAAGNEYEKGNSPSYPAAYNDYVIAVGATRYDETRSYYSNTGNYIDMVAPGGDLNIDQNGDGYIDGVLQQTFNPNTKNTRDFGYWFFQGTSMASPHVAGVAALVIANKNATTPDEVRAALETTAEDKGAIGRDDAYGHGLVDARAALDWISGPECTAGATMDCGINIGACEYGTQTCSAEGVWGDCVDAIYPTTETCNGVDDDCDGTVDQITQECGETNLGACEYGIQICSEGNWGECVGAIYPTTETCNGLDDDCNGILPSNESDADSDDYMICENDCNDNEAAINPGAVEICDEVDNNCNEEIDEGGVCEVQPVLCWDEGNGHLYRNKDQFKKFCKCASGVYGYQDYVSERSRGKVYQYSDAGDNTNWDVFSRYSFSQVKAVKCTDGELYSTSESHYR